MSRSAGSLADPRRPDIDRSSAGNRQPVAGAHRVSIGLDPSRRAPMPESQAFWLMTTGLQVVDCFGKAPGARARFDEGGWLALTGEASADLNMGCVLDGPAAAALLDNYVAEIDGLPTILLFENP